MYPNYTATCIRVNSNHTYDFTFKHRGKQKTTYLTFGGGAKLPKVGDTLQIYWYPYGQTWLARSK